MFGVAGEVWELGRYARVTGGGAGSARCSGVPCSSLRRLARVLVCDFSMRFASATKNDAMRLRFEVTTAKVNARKVLA